MHVEYASSVCTGYQRYPWIVRNTIGNVEIKIHTHNYNIKGKWYVTIVTIWLWDSITSSGTWTHSLQLRGNADWDHVTSGVRVLVSFKG